MTRVVVLLVVTAATGLFAVQAPALRIVVLEGENSVNIIQQKTAVRAVVEVRDQNNLPVQGASVTFAVTGKGGATVAGAQTVTVATNTAGQAALTGVTPASSGGLQISVNASFNGLSAATTITQTVVATAAAAATVGAATAAATTGAAVGGGISTGAIVGIVGGVVAVGGGVAVAGGGGGDDGGDDGPDGPPTGQQDPLPACVFAVSPREQFVPIAGGTFGFSVSVTPTNCLSPEWRVDTNLSSHFVSANPVSGTGTGTFTLTFTAFTPTATFPSRSGAIGVAGTTIQIFQPTRF